MFTIQQYIACIALRYKYGECEQFTKAESYLATLSERRSQCKSFFSWVLMLQLQIGHDFMDK